MPNDRLTPIARFTASDKTPTDPERVTPTGVQRLEQGLEFLRSAVATLTTEVHANTHEFGKVVASHAALTRKVDDFAEDLLALSGRVEKHKEDSQNNIVLSVRANLDEAIKRGMTSWELDAYKKAKEKQEEREEARARDEASAKVQRNIAIIGAIVGPVVAFLIAWLSAHH